MTETIHERLSGGVAQLSAASDADGPAVTPEIVPIGENEVTQGLSGERLYWPESTLREATEAGAFDGAKLLKGRPDVGHKEISSQASPDEIAGGAGTFEYEPGRGPVSSDGTVVDEHLGKLIDHGLVEISADFSDLEIGEYDEERDARPVESVGDVPYITLLDQGASSGASISTGRAEQLGFNPDGAGDGGDAQDSDEEADTSTGPDEDTESNMADQDKVEELHEQLAAVREEKAQVESERDSLKTEKESLEEQTDTLESEVEEKESELSEKEERIDEMEDELEETRSEAEFSRRQAALIAVGGNEAAAETLVESDRSADDLAEMALDSDHGPEVLPSTDEETDDEQLSPMDKLNEQLASPPAQRGQSPGDGEETGVNGGNLTDEQLAAGDERALEVMDSSDIRTASEEGLSRREYFRKHKGVDPARVESTEQLRAKLNGDGGDA